MRGLLLRPGDRTRITGNSEVISSHDGLVPTNALVVIDAPTPGVSVIRKLSANSVRRSCLVSAESIIEHSAGQDLFQSQNPGMGQKSCLI